MSSPVKLHKREGSPSASDTPRSKSPRSGICAEEPPASSHTPPGLTLAPTTGDPPTLSGNNESASIVAQNDDTVQLAGDKRTTESDVIELKKMVADLSRVVQGLCEHQEFIQGALHHGVNANDRRIQELASQQMRDKETQEDGIQAVRGVVSQTASVVKLVDSQQQMNQEAVYQQRMDQQRLQLQQVKLEHRLEMGEDDRRLNQRLIAEQIERQGACIHGTKGALDKLTQNTQADIEELRRAHEAVAAAQTHRDEMNRQLLEAQARAAAASTRADQLAREYKVLDAPRTKPPSSNFSFSPNVDSPAYGAAFGGHPGPTHSVGAPMPRLTSESEHYPTHGAANATGGIPADNNTGLVGAMLHLPQVLEPPKFDECNYEEWKKKVDVWKMMHPYFPESHLVLNFSRNAEGSFKILFLQYIQETGERPAGRTIGALLKRLDMKYAMKTEDLKLVKLSQFNSMKRRVGESYRDFWVRFDKALRTLRSLGVVVQADLLYPRAMLAANLSDAERMSVMVVFEARGINSDLEELKRISTKLFDKPPPEKATANIAHVSDEGMCEPGDADGPPEYSLDETPDGTYVLNPVKNSKNRNRPSAEASAITNTRATLNIKNRVPKSDITCFKCHEKGHFARDCSLPYKRFRVVPDEGPSKGRDRPATKGAEKGKWGGKGKGKRVYMMTDDGEMWETNDTWEEYDQQVAEVDAQPAKDLTNNRGGDPVELPALEPSPAPAALQMWQDEMYDVMTLHEVVCAAGGMPSSFFSTTHKILIDSGASSTVAGREWIARWFCSDPPKLSPSGKRFRFGDSRVFSSDGSYVANTYMICVYQKKLTIIAAFITIRDIHLPISFMASIIV